MSCLREYYRFTLCIFLNTTANKDENMNDLSRFGIYVVLIIALILVSDMLRKLCKFTTSFSRKSVHIGVGVLSMIALFFFESPLYLMVGSVLFIVVNSILTFVPLAPGLQTNRKSFGLPYFPLAFLVLLCFCWDSHKFLILYGLAQLTFADCFASMIGERFKSRVFTFLTDKKSVNGSATLFLSSFVITTLLFVFHPLDMPGGFEIAQILLIALIMAIISTLLEAVSVWGSDNVTLPLISPLFFILAVRLPDHFIATGIAATVLASLLGSVALKKKWLTSGGVAMMFLQTYMIIIFGSLKLIIPMLLFFLLSSVISKVIDRIKGDDTIEKKGSERDGWQVFANGSFPATLAVLGFFFPELPHLALYSIAICAAVSDTWSSEIGALSKGDPISIFTLRKVPKGISGGVSLLGTLGGFGGSFFVALIIWGLFSELLTFKMAMLIGFCGSLGTIIDSVLGALVQVKLRCSSCGKITESENHCGEKTNYHSGIKWINNDVVNWLSIGFTVIISAVIITTLF